MGDLYDARRAVEVCVQCEELTGSPVATTAKELLRTGKVHVGLTAIRDRVRMFKRDKELFGQETARSRIKNWHERGRPSHDPRPSFRQWMLSETQHGRAVGRQEIKERLLAVRGPSSKRPLAKKTLLKYEQAARDISEIEDRIKHARNRVVAMNVHPAYTALIFKSWKGAALKMVEGRAQNLTRVGTTVVVRCCFHSVKWCARKGCAARRSGVRHSNAVLDLADEVVRGMCAICRAAIYNYRRSWQKIASAVQLQHPEMNAEQAMQHVRVPQSWLGKIVGQLMLGPGVSVDGVCRDTLRAQTLATEEFLATFKVTHSLGSVQTFESPLSSCNRAKPGLWVAELEQSE